MGLLILIPGITGWINAVNNEGAVSIFLGLTFSITITIIGGTIILIDLIIFLIYFLAKKKKSS
ncbi:MAG: hypothetical protein WC907_06560 [Acholeplasmataceae bacterium]